MFTHARCGGVLIPEEHRRLVMDQNEARTPRLAKGGRYGVIETLHRCDTCGLVGVAAKRSDDDK